VLLVCFGCAAQSANTDLNKSLERQVRSYFSIPAGVQINIGERKPSPEFPGYDALTITFTQGENTKKYDFLLSKDAKTLVRLTKLDVSSDPYAETMKKIDTSGRPVRGNRDAKVTIVNYDDFQCPFCSRMHQTLMSDIIKNYGDRVRIIYKDFPLYDIHPWANRAAVNANCLNEQSSDAYWAFADYLHANQRQIGGGKPVNEQLAELDRLAQDFGKKSNLEPQRLQACLKAQSDSAVRASVKEAAALGVSATPTLFVNGEKIDGAVPQDEVRAVIDRALVEAGQKPGAAQASSASPPGTPDR
jgi:protein-disulfide isomerase